MHQGVTAAIKSFLLETIKDKYGADYSLWNPSIVNMKVKNNKPALAVWEEKITSSYWFLFFLSEPGQSPIRMVSLNHFCPLSRQHYESGSDTN